MRYVNGSVYEGNFACGDMGGEGTMKFANGDSYKGKWRYG